jgi:hypothetical protein
LKVSNQPISEEEFESWVKVCEADGKKFPSRAEVRQAKERLLNAKK